MIKDFINDAFSDLDSNTKKTMVFNFYQTIAYFSSLLLGEAMQYLTKSNVMDYNWLTGHLSDITLPAEFTGIGLSFFNNKYANLLSVLVPPTLSTINELRILNLIERDTYDSQDIACFWAGSLLAYGLSKANEKGVFKKASNKIKNIFGKKSLEILTEE